MRAAKRRIHGAALAALLLVVATASTAAAKAGPAAGAAGSGSPLLATVDVGLDAGQHLDIGASGTAAGVELALEAPRSWTYLDDLARFAEDAKWRLEVDIQGPAGRCLEPSVRLKTRVRGYQLFRGGNGAFRNSLIPYATRDCDPSRTPRHVGGLLLTTDPLGYVDGPNLYQFALNNPVNYSDPMGLLTLGPCGTKVGDAWDECMAERRAREEEFNNSTVGQYTNGTIQGVVVSPVEMVKAGYQVVRHPIQTAQGLWYVVTNPFEVAAEGIVDFQRASSLERGRSVGGILGGFGAAGAAGKTVRVARSTLRFGDEAASAATVARAETAIISRVGRGQGGHQVVDRIAAEAQGALGQANRILQSGGAGGTRWGAVYQRVSGRGSWFENMARRNALHSIAERQMLSNRYVLEAIDQGVVVQFNRGSLLGARSPKGALLRPDIQIRGPQGRFGIIDWTTEGSARKIFKYGDPVGAPWMINVTVP